jgi:predicted O-methyltransferase YrrM
MGRRSQAQGPIVSTLRQVAREFRKRLVGARPPTFELKVIRAAPGSFLEAVSSYESPRARAPELFDRVEALAAEADRAGKLPLWEGYTGVDNYPKETGPNATRSSSQVRTGPLTGAFFVWLVTQRQPDVVVEFGAAFGVSGMYWLTGLEMIGKGRLFSFEPNPHWGPIAEANMKAISDRVHFTLGTFEDNVGIVRALDEPIGIAFIDAIHTSAFVLPQLELVLSCCAPGSLVVLDDIGFSKDMAQCWKTVSADPRFRAAVSTERIGIVEVA